MELVAPPLAPATQMSFWGPPGQGHVPFDQLTLHDCVERPMLDAIGAGSSAAIIGVRGGGKSSVLVWVCR
jgi:hypothetical protein